jgi:hypothetical protein
LSFWSSSYLVAGVSMEIVSSVGDPSPYLPDQMRDFASPGQADLVVSLLYDESAQSDPLKRFFPSKFTLTLHAEADGFSFEGVNGKKRHMGLITMNRDRGEIALPRLDRTWRIAQEREVVTDALQAFIKACLQCHLAGLGGTLLHAAGVAYGGEGYAFVGHTRAGKTTLSRGLPASAVLGDDLVAVREIGEKHLLFGTPWPGREGGDVSYGGLPLRAIFNLHPELTRGLRRMAPAEAVAELAVNAPRLGYSGEEDELLEVFSSAASALPIYELSMRLGDDLASWLEIYRKEEDKDHRQGTGG